VHQLDYKLFDIFDAWCNYEEIKVFHVFISKFIHGSFKRFSSIFFHKSEFNSTIFITSQSFKCAVISVWIISVIMIKKPIIPIIKYS